MSKVGTLGRENFTSKMLDAHCHFWSVHRGDYDWLQGGDEPLAAIRRDFDPTDYPASQKAIAVQAAATVAETDYLLSLAARHSFIAGVVGWFDLADSNAIALLEERAANPLLKGVRPMLQDVADTEWLLTAPVPEVLATLVRLGLRFDALITERHLPVLSAFATRNPDLPIVIDHGAKPQPGDKSAWADGMRNLAGNPNVHCKLSGLLTELSPAELKAPLQALQDVVTQLLEWFGPERLIWGSDWPVLTLAAEYEEWCSLTDQLLVQVSATEKMAILGGNAARFYGVEGF